MVDRSRSSFRARTAALLLALLVGNSLALAQANKAAEPNELQSAPLASGQRVFTCGHSFHVFVYRLVGEMAKAAGFEDH